MKKNSLIDNIAKRPIPRSLLLTLFSIILILISSVNRIFNQAPQARLLIIFSAIVIFIIAIISLITRIVKNIKNALKPKRKAYKPKKIKKPSKKRR